MKYDPAPNCTASTKERSMKATISIAFALGSGMSARSWSVIGMRRQAVAGQTWSR